MQRMQLLYIKYSKVCIHSLKARTNINISFSSHKTSFTVLNDPVNKFCNYSASNLVPWLYVQWELARLQQLFGKSIVSTNWSIFATVVYLVWLKDLMRDSGRSMKIWFVHIPRAKLFVIQAFQRAVQFLLLSNITYSGYPFFCLAIHGFSYKRRHIRGTLTSLGLEIPPTTTAAHPFFASAI